MKEKYVVINNFKDLEDKNHLYLKGDIYPREGLEPTNKRIKELSTEKNKTGKKLIQKVEESTEVEEVKEETEVKE